MSAEEPKNASQRILQAALEEFVEFGYAGARMDRIAKRAQCNKGLLYHHHGGKETLWRLVLNHKLTEEGPDFFAIARKGNVEETILALFDKSRSKDEYGRLLMWEELAFQDRDIVNAEERSAYFQKMASAMEVVEDEELRPAVVLAIISLAAMPHLLSNVTRMVSGHDSDSPEFRKIYRRALQWLSENSLDAHHAAARGEEGLEK